jgi:hypothetical protein
MVVFFFRLEAIRNLEAKLGDRVSFFKPEGGRQIDISAFGWGGAYLTLSKGKCINAR